MKKFLLYFALALGLVPAVAQNVYTALPSPSPLVCSDFTVFITGDFPATNYLITGETVSVNGSIITVQLNCDAPGFGLTIISPFTHTATIPANTVPSGGPYTLNIQTFFQPFGVTSTLSQQLTVGSCCAAVAEFQTDSTDYCWDENILITDSSSGTTTVDWYVNSVLDHTGAGDFVLSGQSGPTEILQVVSNGSCSDSALVMVNVNPEPPTAFSHIQNVATFTFTAQGGSGFIYDWDFGDGTTDVGPLVTHTYTADGNYNVCLTSTDSDLCQSDSCITVTYSTIGLDETSPEIRIYPNPAADIVQIEGFSTTNIQWYNELGQLIEIAEENTSHEYIHVFDVSDLPAGLYYIQWADKAEKIIIQ